MISILKTIGLSLLILFFLQGCVSDTKSTGGNNNANQSAVQAASQQVDDHAGHDHSGHDHSGHDHSGHDHAGHDHSGHDHDDHAGHNHAPGEGHGQSAEDKLNKAKAKRAAIVGKTKEQQIQEVESMSGEISQTDIEKKKAGIRKAVQSEIPPPPTSSLPSACDLVTDGFIAKTMDVDVSAVTIKDGTNKISHAARSCFFRWSHKGVPNSGVLVQVQENPLPEEIDEWAAYYIQAKLNQGEIDPSGTAYKYKPFEGLGVKGAYSYEMHRYLWRTKEGYVFMIAFNINATEKEELAWAKTIGKEMLNNF